MICMKNPYILVKAEKQAVGGKVKTLEGEAIYNAGDFIVTGIANEQWVVKPDINNENVPKGYILVNTDENTFQLIRSNISNIKTEKHKKIEQEKTAFLSLEEERKEKELIENFAKYQQNQEIDNYIIPSTSEEESESLLNGKNQYGIVSTSKSNFVGDNDSGNHANMEMLAQKYGAEAQAAKESEKISKKQQGKEPKFTL